MSEPEKKDIQTDQVRELPLWACETRAFDGQPSVSLEELFVGDKYLLKCEGEYVEDFDNSKAKFVFEKQESSYSFHILSVRTFDNTEMWAEVTSYKPGEHQFDGVQLTDSKHKIKLSGEKPVLIQSQLQKRPQEEAISPEAQKILFFGPFPLAIPMWFWLAVAIVVTVICGGLARYFYKRIQKKKLIEELSKHSTALNPYSQFHKEIRQLMRKFTGPGKEKLSLTAYMQELDTSFRMFLVREFLIPAMEWRTSAVMSELKGAHKKIYRYAGPQVRKLLVEFERAKSAGEKNKIEDCEQMIEMSRRVVDQIQKVRRVEK